MLTFCPSHAAASLATLLLFCSPGLARADNLQDKLRRALELEQAGRLEQSIEIYREVLKEHPGSAPAHAGLGRAWYHAKQYSEAAQSFERALRLQPGNPQTLRWLARSYLRTGEPQKVLDLFPRAATGEEKRPWVHLLLARAYDAQDKLTEATRELQHALALDRRCPGAHFALGFIAWTSRDLPAAETEFREELAINRGHRLAHYYLAEVLMTQEKTPEAESLLKEMAREFPQCYFAHLGTGKLEERRGNLEKAAQQFRQAVRIDPEQMEAHYRLALVLRKLGQNTEAEKEFGITHQLRMKDQTQIRQGMGLMRARIPDFE